MIKENSLTASYGPSSLLLTLVEFSAERAQDTLHKETTD